MSVIVTSIKDPFKPVENIKDICEFEEDTYLDHYLTHINLDDPDITFVIGLNGIIIDNSKLLITEVRDGDLISVSARIDATATAWLASTVASFIVGGSTAFATAITYSVAYGLTYAATTFAIGYGLNALASALGPEVPSVGGTGASTAVEQTYGWGELRQTAQEGTRIAYLFGTNKVAGHIINQFITVQNNDETLNTLIGICDHQIDSITDIKLNSQAFTNFRDTDVYLRLGTNDDAAIEGFGELVTQTDVGSKLIKDSSVIIKTAGNQVDKLVVVVSASNGLYYSNNSGGLDSREATFTIEYKTAAAGSWTVLSEQIIGVADPSESNPNSNGGLSGLITYTDSVFHFSGEGGGTTEPQKASFIIGDLTPNQYEIRVIRKNDEEESFRGSSDIYFSSFQEIIKEELIYPGLATYAVKILATDQLSGSAPAYTCIASRNTVDIYNEITGYWESKRATNPAWIVYTLLVEFANIPVSKIIYSDFLEWAEYCDELIDDKYRFILNVVIYEGNFWDEIQKVAKMGRAQVIRRGTRYGLFIDKPEITVSDIFTMGNIIEKSFNLQYLPKKDRASGVEIEYSDVDREYDRQVITIYSNEYLAGEEIAQKANVSLQSSMTQAQAIREGVYRINSNQLLNRVITFDAFVDSFACTVGDLFYFQSDIPNYTEGIGGRILSAGNDNGSGSPYVQIDKEFTIVAGITYSILVRLRDNTIIEKVISNLPETTDTFTLTSEWSTVPTVDIDEAPVYNLGNVSSFKKIYRLTGVTRQDDFIRTLTAVEYVPEIYSNNDGFIIDEIDEVSTSQVAIGVTTKESLIFNEFGSYVSNLAVSWDTLNPAGLGWDIWLEDITVNSPPVKIISTTVNSITITNNYLIKNHKLRIYINTIGEGATSYFSNISEITIQGKDVLPENVSQLFLQNNQLVWEYAGNRSELAGFKIKSGIGSDVSWTYAEFINDGEFVTSPFPLTARNDTVTYLVKAYDYSGFESEVPAALIINLGDTLVENLVEEEILSPPFDGTIINGTVISDKLYADSDGNFWQGDPLNNIWTGSAGNTFFASKFKEMTYIGSFTPQYPGIEVLVGLIATAPTGLLIYIREAHPFSYWSGNPVASFSLAWDSDPAPWRLLEPKVALTEQLYDLKIITNSSVGQSIIEQISIQYDFLDIIETFEDIVVGSGGIRLPITKTYKKIKNVSLTLQDDGGTAVTINIADKDADLGPFIYAEDKDRGKTTATIDAIIQGY